MKDVEVLLCFVFNQVWSLALVKNSKYLITGSSDSELRMWEIQDAHTLQSSRVRGQDISSDVNGDEEQSDIAVSNRFMIV